MFAKDVCGHVFALCTMSVRHLVAAYKPPMLLNHSRLLACALLRWEAVIVLLWMGVGFDSQLLHFGDALYLIPLPK